MKKNLLFVIPLIAVAVLLFMLRATGIIAHIAVSVAGLVLLVAYAVTTKKSWKCPALEILERIFYAVALITGVVLMNIHGIAIITIVHRISAVLFVIIFIAAEIHKIIKK